MKVTLQRDALLTAVRSVAQAVPTTSSIAALKNIKATAQDDSLQLIAHDATQGVGIRYDLRGVTVTRSGSCILPKDQLVQILAESSDPAVTLDAGSQAVVAIAGGRFEMLSLDVAEFPDLPAFDDGGRYHEVAAGSLRTMLKRVAFAADKKNTTEKFALTGVLWEADGKTTRLVATDTKRLAVCEGPATVFGEPDATKAVRIVPLKAVALLEKNLVGDAELVRIALRTNDALFQTERATIYTSLLQGKFPPYRDVIAKTKEAATQKVTLPVAEFFSRVRQSAIMTDDESLRVDMLFEAGKVTMKARGVKVGSSLVSLELPGHDGPTTEVAFDPLYLIEFLKVIDAADPLTLHMGDGKAAVLFTSGDSHQYLVMPLTG